MCLVIYNGFDILLSYLKSLMQIPPAAQQTQVLALMLRIIHIQKFHLNLIKLAT